MNSEAMFSYGLLYTDIQVLNDQLDFIDNNSVWTQYVV